MKEFNINLKIHLCQFDELPEQERQLVETAIQSTNHAYAKDALKSAAYTYVVAALGSLATLIYYIMIFMGRSRD